MRTKQYLIQVCLLMAVLFSEAGSSAQTVTKIAAGGYHSLFLKSDGSLWAMGLDSSGQLGDGNSGSTAQGQVQTNRPEQIVAGNVTTIAAGETHSMFLKSDGSLWVMGDNTLGQLGDDRYSDDPFYGVGISATSPEMIVAGNVTAISGGGGDSFFLKNDGSLWGTGGNISSELGIGNDTWTLHPLLIVTSNVTAAGTGNDFEPAHCLFIKSNGSLWGMGDNEYGQLGDGTYTYTNRPEQILASNVTAIAAGAGFSLLLKSDSSLWAMGINYYGQLGDGNSGFTVQTNRPEQIVASNVTAIAAGRKHSLFLKRDGSLWGMGNNEYGQLGDGTTTSISQPKQLVSGGVMAISAGVWHSLFLKSDGSLWGMGFSVFGQLGDGTNSYTLGYTNLPEQIVGGNPSYNQITSQALPGGKVLLGFLGNPGANYSLDRVTSLSSPTWSPQATNTADGAGSVIFTNTPVPATNNFWRVRLVQ